MKKLLATSLCIMLSLLLALAGAPRDAGAGETIKIGSLHDLTGGLNIYGIQMSQGLKLADGETLRFKRAVIATGARASAPAIAGLDTVPYLTNETLFSLTERPPRLGIIGAGPMGYLRLATLPVGHTTREHLDCRLCFTPKRQPE